MSDSDSIEDSAQPAARELSRQISHASAAVRIMSSQDAESRYRVAEADNRIPSGIPTSGCSKKIISWEPNDEENPYNWSSVSDLARLHIRRPTRQFG
jgi:hypothetical protein